MTYKELLDKLGELSKEQLNRNVILYNLDSEDDIFYDARTLSISVTEVEGLIDKDYPYITFDLDL
jgi:predicted nuclease of restriction endonuclease-like RecB superfamily